MIIYRGFFSFFFIFFNSLLFAGQVEISGYAKGAEGRSIRLKIIRDYISEEPQELGKALINDSGYFVLLADISQTQKAKIQIDYYDCEIFLEEGASYHLNFTPFDYYQNEKINALQNPHALQSLSYSLDKTDTAELNNLIWRFNYEYNVFLDTSFYAISKGERKKDVGAFIEQIKGTFAYSGHDFFIGYMMYKLAMLEDFARLKKDEKEYQDYIRDKKLSYKQEAQAEFFKQYYQNRIEDVFDRKTSLFGVLDTMGFDTTLQNERLREWVFLYAAKEKLRRRYRPEFMMQLIAELGEQSKFVEHKEIAENIKNQYLRKQEMFYFEGMKFPDERGDSVNFQDKLSENKINYIVLFDSKQCISCLGEFYYLRKLAQMYEDILQVIFINTQYEYAAFYHDVQDKKYPWPYLHFGGNIDWLKEIGAIHSPYGLLLDARARVRRTDINSPSRDLEPILRNEREKRKQQELERKKEKAPKR